MKRFSVLAGFSGVCSSPSLSAQRCTRQIPLGNAAAWCGVAAVASVALLVVVSYDPASGGSVFCHVTNFTRDDGFYPVPNATSEDSVSDFISSGQPFLVGGVTWDWPASEKWSHSYFRRIFEGHALFSSTFSTPRQPQFQEDYPNKEVYYGIFLNDQSLAELVANDYHYPHFIPDHLKLHGRLDTPISHLTTPPVAQVMSGFTGAILLVELRDMWT